MTFPKVPNQLSKKLRELAATTHFPTPMSLQEKKLSREEKIKAIAKHMKVILQILGLDLEDDSLKDSPIRIAQMYVDEVFAGLDLENFPRITYLEDKFDHEAGRFILTKDITFTSFCEHHFVPMEGFAHVAYIPNKKIIGLSKMHRIVRYFSQRPQIQERLNSQIADSLATVLDTEHVAVLISSKHSCVTSRGVFDACSNMQTFILRGAFRNDPLVRSEFFQLIKS